MEFAICSPILGIYVVDSYYTRGREYAPRGILPRGTKYFPRAEARGKYLYRGHNFPRTVFPTPSVVSDLSHFGSNFIVVYRGSWEIWAQAAMPSRAARKPYQASDWLSHIFPADTGNMHILPCCGLSSGKYGRYLPANCQGRKTRKAITKDVRVYRLPNHRTPI
jgi:hypothetical protein